MNTLSDDVRAALCTLEENLPTWLEEEERRKSVAGEITSQEGQLVELNYLRQLVRPEPWQQDRLRLLEVGVDDDRKRVAELREEQHRHEETTKQLQAAERIVFRFAEEHGINAEPLMRLLARRELER